MSSTFEVHGYFETLHEIATNKTLGTRTLTEAEWADAFRAGRALGVDGETVVEITAPIVLQRGHKTVTVSASPEKPRRCYSTLRPICGRAIPK